MVSRNRKKCYSRSGEFVEVRARRYGDLVQECAKGLSLGEAPPKSVLSLFHSDDTIIPAMSTGESRGEWVLQDYLKSVNRHASQMKFGIGYILKVCCV